jgi:hypothetical protein
MAAILDNATEEIQEQRLGASGRGPAVLPVAGGADRAVEREPGGHDPCFEGLPGELGELGFELRGGEEEGKFFFPVVGGPGCGAERIPCAVRTGDIGQLPARAAFLWNAIPLF